MFSLPNVANYSLDMWLSIYAAEREAINVAERAERKLHLRDKVSPIFVFDRMAVVDLLGESEFSWLILVFVT